jgi:hypothetical protein
VKNKLVSGEESMTFMKEITIAIVVPGIFVVNALGRGYRDRE